MLTNPTRSRAAGALASLLCSLLLAAQAQAQSPGMPRPDPLDPAAQVPAVRHVSPFAQFRRMADEPPLGWREANDAVARIGGWRVYTREAQQPDPVASDKPAAPAQPPASAPAGHPGHRH